MKHCLFALLFLAVGAPALALPGYSVQRIGPTSGFATSIAIDSHGTIYYTSQGGNLYRVDQGQSSLVAHVITAAVSDSGLLGMALRDDDTAVVHYTTPGETAEVISTIDLTTGQETILRSLACNIENPMQGVPGEHHGGNPTVTADGSIFVGIGDYGGGLIAALPQWNAGKIFQITAHDIVQFASGFRNPFGMVWDGSKQRLIATDNGDVGNDTIRIVHQGDFCGWPFTEGTKPPVPGAVPPLYTFPFTVAPTAMIALSGRNPTLSHGYLIGAFAAQAIFWVRDIDAQPLPDPIPLISKQTDGVVGIAEAPNGAIFFVTGEAIYRLIVPIRARAARQ